MPYDSTGFELSYPDGSANVGYFEYSNLRADDAVQQRDEYFNVMPPDVPLDDPGRYDIADTHPYVADQLWANARVPEHAWTDHFV